MNLFHAKQKQINWYVCVWCALLVEGGNAHLVVHACVHGSPFGYMHILCYMWLAVHTYCWPRARSGVLVRSCYRMLGDVEASFREHQGCLVQRNLPLDCA